MTTDVAYRDDTATAAAILHPTWETEEIARAFTKTIGPVAPYEPGRFYLRELPCILSLLEEIDHDLETIIVDGYVDLGADRRPGLGRHLYEALGEKTPVVGVAKRAFKDTPDACKLMRGRSKRPLYVTAAGIPLQRAKARIVAMHGENRIPTLLRKADAMCRRSDP